MEGSDIDVEKLEYLDDQYKFGREQPPNEDLLLLRYTEAAMIVRSIRKLGEPKLTRRRTWWGSSANIECLSQNWFNNVTSVRSPFLSATVFGPSIIVSQCQTLDFTIWKVSWRPYSQEIQTVYILIRKLV